MEVDAIHAEMVNLTAAITSVTTMTATTMAVADATTTTMVMMTTTTVTKTVMMTSITKAMTNGLDNNNNLNGCWRLHTMQCIGWRIFRDSTGLNNILLDS